MIGKNLPLLHFFKFSNYSLIGIGFLAFAQSEILPLLAEISLAFLLVIFFVLEMKGLLPRYTPYRFRWEKLIAFSLAVYFYTQGGELFDVAGYLVVANLFLKILFKKDDTDYLFCHFLSLVLMVIGCIASVELSFILIFLGFTMNITWCLILYHLKSEEERKAHKDEDETAGYFAVLMPQAGSRTLLGASFLAGTSLLVLATFLGTLFIFFFFPRVHPVFFQFNAKKRGHVTSGFGNEVVLGEIGRIQENSSVAFRVILTQGEKRIKLQGMPYWRGLSLDYYDGKKWENRSPLPSFHPLNVNNVFFANQPSKDAHIVTQDVYMEAETSSTVLFFAGEPLSIQSPSFRKIGRDDHQTYRFLPSPSGKYRYSAEVDLHPANRKLYISPSSPTSKPSLENYLQLPPLSERFFRMTKEFAGSGVPFQKASNLDSALKSGYQYSLKMTQKEGVSPLEYFLFESRKGHCEYFSTALVLMLRAVGIPARLVTGFAGGEWNETGGYYIVRERDAHSWAEGYFEDQGWVAFDPTPPARFVAVDDWRSSAIFRYLDYAQLAWDRYIINYSRKDQADALHALAYKEFEMELRVKSVWAQVKREIRRWMADVSLSPFWIIGFSGFWIFVIMKGGKYWARRIREKKYATRRGSVYFYEKFLGGMEKKGAVKALTETAEEFAHRVESEFPDQGDVAQAITGFYQKVRFGEKELREEEKAKLSEILG